MKCQARITKIEIDPTGKTHIKTYQCSSENETGSDLCYLHHKYEQGLCEPNTIDVVRTKTDMVVKVETPRGVVWELER